MRRFAVPLLALVLLLGAVATARADETKYVCDPLNFPDGTSGVAVVRVVMSGGLAAAPTVMVTVDYYSPGQAEFLGRFEDWSSTGNFPTNEYEASEFAVSHYYDRW